MHISQFNLYLDISYPLRRDIVKASNELKGKSKSVFRLDLDKFMHLSLYLFTTPEQSKADVLAVVEQIAKELKPFSVMVTGARASSDGLIMISFEKNNHINSIHKLAVKLLNPLRKNTLRKKYTDQEYFLKQTSTDQKLLKKYGHKYVHDNYNPHISLGFVEDDKLCKKIVVGLSERFEGKSAIVTHLKLIEDDYETSDAKEIIFSSSLTA